MKKALNNKIKLLTEFKNKCLRQVTVP